MTLRILLCILLMPLVGLASELEEIFRNPPHDAKPRGYWVWPHGNFDYAAIKHELQEFKAKGLGGVDIFDLGIADPKDVIPSGPAFMSPEQVNGIAFALAEAKKLELKIGLIVSSSWNAGAAWTPPEQAAMNLVASIDTVRGPIKYDKNLPFPALPDSFVKPYGTFPLHIPRDKNGLPQYYQDVATLVFPLSEAGILRSPEQVKRFEGPQVQIELPEGRWVMLRTICTNFGQMLWIPSDNSKGLAIDHFSEEAVRDHFETIIQRLETRCGPLANTALERLYLASYESNADIIWTPALPDEFFERNGYRVEPWLPALFGVTIQDKPTTERFLYDFRKTVSDIFVENLYRNARDICHQHGLKICSEAGGPGPPLHDVPTEDLKALGSLDIMRGEFWVDKKDRLNPDGFEQLQIVKSIASAAHIYGHKIVEMESFTSHDNWRQSPATLKPFADRAFCEGMNRVVYHTMSHNLPEAGQPGWSFGAGTHINTNLTWWNLSDQFHAYLARCSALLQQGHFVADVCFYYGHEIPNFARPKHIRPSLGSGYEYDDLNTEVLLTAEVREGRLVLPGGMSYAVLVLPADDRMDLVVLQKIKKLLNDGATIIGPRPQRVYGLAGYREQETELKKLTDELWGQKNSDKLDKKIGKGRLVVGKSVREVLTAKGIGPDVEFLNASSDLNLDFIHRRTQREDIYFIRNGDSAVATVEVRFRVQNRQPQLWNAVTGEMQKCAIFRQEKTGIRLPLHLEPHGSVFVVFTENPGRPQITEVHYHGKQCFPGTVSPLVIHLNAHSENDRIIFYASKPGSYKIDLSDGRQKNVLVEAASEFRIEGPWAVRFPHGWGAAPVQTFDSLYSWTDAKQPGTRAFSGTATYRKNFTVPEALMGENRRLVIDLGEVREIARVYLNGRELGISSFTPHTFDVTDIIRAGENYLVIKVANTWLNRLIADDQQPAEKRLTHTNLTRGPTGRTAWREAKPKPSGLLGPVRVFSFRKIVL